MFTTMGQTNSRQKKEYLMGFSSFLPYPPPTTADSGAYFSIFIYCRSLECVATKLGFPRFAKHETRQNCFPVSRNGFWWNFTKFVLNHFAKFCNTSLKEKIFTIKKLDDIVPFITVSDRKGLNQPACQEGWKKCKKERRIVLPMWCIYVCPCVSCNIVMLFTCTWVRSHPDSKEALGVKPDPLR